jgi:DUF4097 and DUF4098 domain-containing protein YvlB
MAPKPAPLPAAPQISVTSRSGRITVTGEDRDDIVVERGGGKVVREGDRVVIDGGSSRVELRCPAGTDVIVGTGSGKVELRGRLGDARVTTGSGAITVEEVERLDARTGSGTVRVDGCEGACKCKTGSGSIRVGRAGDAELVTGSGRVTADLVDGAEVKAGSGRVDVGLRSAGKVGVQAHSGSVNITVPAGMHPATRLKAHGGSVVCDCEEGSDGDIQITTNSGSISITEA